MNASILFFRELQSDLKTLVKSISLSYMHMTVNIYIYIYIICRYRYIYIVYVDIYFVHMQCRGCEDISLRDMVNFLTHSPYFFLHNTTFICVISLFPYANANYISIAVCSPYSHANIVPESRGRESWVPENLRSVTRGENSDTLCKVCLLPERIFVSL